jgi:hypothetical protein
MGKIIKWIALQDHTYESWLRFRDELATLILLCIFLGGIAVVLLYHRSAVRLKIRGPRDPFRPYTPLLWEALSLIPAGIAAGWHFFQYQKILGGHVPLDELSLTFAITASLTWLLAQIVVSWFPGVTPAKFRYHPRLLERWLWGRRRA